MNHFTLAFVLLFSAQVLISQQAAPDFTVRDSRDSYHTLYEDYLDKGKTVLIKFFYSSCPPCNSIAPSVQALYTEWGEGDYDVEFIELSIQAWETDESVNTYVDKHDITFPGVSAEGGSLDAMDAMESEGYGPVFSTPTFAVIAPGGSVNWNIRGFNNEQTIDALDNAIAETGAEKPTSSTDNPSTGVFTFNIRPNPVDDLLNIEFVLPEAGELNLTIFNILGSALEHVNLGMLQSGVRQEQYAVSQYRSGTYIVRAELNDKYIKSIRFVKK